MPVHIVSSFVVTYPSQVWNSRQNDGPMPKAQHISSSEVPQGVFHLAYTSDYEVDGFDANVRDF